MTNRIRQCRLIGLLVAFLAVSPVFLRGETCKITGEVPDKIREVICLIATAAHGGEAPVNALVVMLKRSVALDVASKSLDSKNTLLGLLKIWMTLRDVKVARVEVFYGEVHIATVKTHVFRGPSVTYH